MLITKRQLIVAGTTVVAGGTVAAAAAIRKPGPHIFTPVAPPVVAVTDLQNASTLQVNADAPPVPDFTYTDGVGRSYSIRKLNGLGVVLNFWATWCPPCVAELPALSQLAHMVANEGILVLALSIDRGSVDKVEKYLADHRITGITTLFDRNSTASRLLGNRGVPTTIVIDREGRQRARLEGPADWAAADLVREVRRLTA